MADVSVIKTPSGSEYHIKDAIARSNFFYKKYSITIGTISMYSYVVNAVNIQIQNLTPLALRSWIINEDHIIPCSISIEPNGTLYYKLKNYDSGAVNDVLFEFVVVYVKTPPVELE